MLRRAPTNHCPDDPKITSATSGGYGVVSKPFKAPTPLSARRINVDLPARKRKTVSYKEQGGGDDDSSSDAEGSTSKKSKYAMGNKEYGEDGVLGGMGKWCNRKFPVFAPKERTLVFGKR